MKREDLKKLELADDVIDQIMKLHGQDIEAQKTQAETAEKQVETLQGQLKDANKTIEGFKDLDVDAIKAAADDWKGKAEQAQKDAEAQIQQLKFEHALEGALSGAKAKNPKAVKALMDMEALKLTDDGSIVGLKEQIEKVQSENDYLFDSDTPAPKVVAGVQGKTINLDSMTAAARKAAGLVSEQ